MATAQSSADARIRQAAVGGAGAPPGQLRVHRGEPGEQIVQPAPHRAHGLGPPVIVGTNDELGHAFHQSFCIPAMSVFSLAITSGLLAMSACTTPGKPCESGSTAFVRIESGGLAE